MVFHKRFCGGVLSVDVGGLIRRRASGLAPVLVLTLALTAPLLHANSSSTQAPSAAVLAEQVRAWLDTGDLSTLLAEVDSQALADEAGLDAAAAGKVRRMQAQLRSQRFRQARVYVHDGKVRVRLDLSPEGLGWLTLDFDPESGLLRGWQDHALGVPLAQLVADMAALAEDRRSRRFLDRLEAEPLQAWRQLPAAHQNAAAARLLLLSCASTGCYEEALIRLDALDSERSVPALWQLDVAVLSRDWRRFDRVHRALHAHLGDDPALVMLTAQAAVARDDCPRALSLAQPAQARWPDYPGLYPLLAECLVQIGDYGAALDVFDAMESRFGTQIDWAAMARHPLYSRLVESDEYRHRQTRP